MDDTPTLPRGGTCTPEAWDDDLPEENWERAVLAGDGVPAVAFLYHIRDPQHWLDLCA
jgi:hypothetical protein